MLQGILPLLSLLFNGLMIYQGGKSALAGLGRARSYPKGGKLTHPEWFATDVKTQAPQYRTKTTDVSMKQWMRPWRAKGGVMNSLLLPFGLMGLMGGGGEESEQDTAMTPNQMAMMQAGGMGQPQGGQMDQMNQLMSLMQSMNM